MPAPPLSFRRNLTTFLLYFVWHIGCAGKKIKLQIWDTAGQERFRTITTSYFRGAQGILLVYDVEDRGSFENIRSWVAQINQHADLAVNKVLIGNKIDIPPEKIKVTEAMGKALASEYNIPFYQTSAKNDLNVTEVRGHSTQPIDSAPFPFPFPFPSSSHSFLSIFSLCTLPPLSYSVHAGVPSNRAGCCGSSNNRRRPCRIENTAPGSEPGQHRLEEQVLLTKEQFYYYLSALH